MRTGENQSLLDTIVYLDVSNVLFLLLDLQTKMHVLKSANNTIVLIQKMINIPVVVRL